MRRLNRALYGECRRNGFTFVDNGAITENDLWVNGIHLEESGKRIIANNVINSFTHFFRICKSVQVISVKESLLLSEPEKVRQNSLEANKECYSEGSLTDHLKRNPLTQPRIF